LSYGKYSSRYTLLMEPINDNGRIVVEWHRNAIANRSVTLVTMSESFSVGHLDEKANEKTSLCFASRNIGLRGRNKIYRKLQLDLQRYQSK